MEDRLQSVQRHVAQLPIWGEWIPSTRMGDTGIGKTFEDVVGIVENNLQEADFNGVEFKAKRSESGALITMFTRNPSTPSRAVHTLVGDYGYDPDERGWKRFNTNFAAGRLTYLGGKHLTLATDSENVHVLADGDICATWTRADIEGILLKKSKSLAMISADTKIDGGIEYFRMMDCSFYWGVDYSRFLALVENASISVHFRVKGNHSKARNRGCAFRIEKASLDLLYSNKLIVKADDR